MGKYILQHIEYVLPFHGQRLRTQLLRIPTWMWKMASLWSKVVGPATLRGRIYHAPHLSPQRRLGPHQLGLVRLTSLQLVAIGWICLAPSLPAGICHAVLLENLVHRRNYVYLWILTEEDFPVQDPTSDPAFGVMTMSLQRLLKGELKWDSDIPTAVVPPKRSDKINCVYRNTILGVTLLKRAAELGLLKESDLSDMYHDPGCPPRQLTM